MSSETAGEPPIFIIDDDEAVAETYALRGRVEDFDELPETHREIGRGS